MKLSSVDLAARAAAEMQPQLADLLRRLGRHLDHWGVGDQYSIASAGHLAWCFVALERWDAALELLDATLAKLKPGGMKPHHSQAATHALALKLRIAAATGKPDREAEQRLREVDVYRNVKEAFWRDQVSETLADRRWDPYVEVGRTVQRNLRELAVRLDSANHIVIGERCAAMTPKLVALIDGELLPAMRALLAAPPPSAPLGETDPRTKLGAISLRSEKGLAQQLAHGATLWAAGRSDEARQALDPIARLGWMGNYDLWRPVACATALWARIEREAGDAEQAARWVVKVIEEPWEVYDEARLQTIAAKLRENLVAAKSVPSWIGQAAYWRENGRLARWIDAATIDAMIDEARDMLAAK